MKFILPELHTLKVYVTSLNLTGGLLKLSRGHNESFLLFHQHSTTGNVLHMNPKYAGSGASSSPNNCVPSDKLLPYFKHQFPPPVK